jgi:hypothetical protein
MNNASPEIRDVFGPKDDGKKKETEVFGAFRYQFQKFFKSNLLTSLAGFGPKAEATKSGVGDQNKSAFVARGPWAELLAYKERMAAQKVQQEIEDANRKEAGSQRDGHTKS